MSVDEKLVNEDSLALLAKIDAITVAAESDILAHRVWYGLFAGWEEDVELIERLLVEYGYDGDIRSVDGSVLYYLAELAEAELASGSQFRYSYIYDNEPDPDEPPNARYSDAKTNIFSPLFSETRLNDFLAAKYQTDIIGYALVKLDFFENTAKLVEDDYNDFALLILLCDQTGPAYSVTVKLDYANAEARVAQARSCCEWWLAHDVDAASYGLSCNFNNDDWD